MNDKTRISDMLHDSLVKRTLDAKTFKAPQCYPFYSPMFDHAKAMEAKAYDLEKELFELKLQMKANCIGVK